MVKTQYVDSDAIERYIENSGIRMNFLAQQLGISRQAFKRKCKGDIPFRVPEVYVMCDLLRIPESEKGKIFCI